MLSCHAKDQCHVKVVKTSTSVMLFPKMLARELEPRESGKEGKHCGKADRGKATWPFGNSLHHRVSLSVK